MKKRLYGILTILLLLPLLAIPAEKEKNVSEWVTNHTIKLDGKVIRYTARAGFIPLSENGTVTARIFYIAYTKDGVTDISKRPIMFSFNGGPGSSSVWMHMGFLGPRKVLYDKEGFALQPPYKLADNVDSILDETDLVFIDPAATGYSHMVKGQDPHKYHGVMEDIASVGEFIRFYVTRNNRWGSSKFLIGESYGTTRASGLTGYLQNQHRMYINGTVLVSMTELGANAGEDIALMTIFPHYTATAWYHKVLPADLQAKPLREVLDQVEAFVMKDYTLALVGGNTLSAQERDRIAGQMARFSGLKKNFILKKNLRVPAHVFRAELLSDRNLTVGRLDSRYTGAEVDVPGTPMRFNTDPAMEAWNGPFTGAVNMYFKQELGITINREYNIFGNVRPWKGRNESNVGQMLHRALIQNPYLRVLVLEGYYDGACDYFTAEYTFSHLDPAGIVKDRIDFRYYECGHMMYVRQMDLTQAKKDLAQFIKSSVAK